MRQRITVGILGLISLFVVGIVLTLLARSREVSARQACLNNLRIMSQFAVESTETRKMQIANKVPIEVVGYVPAGTLYRPELPPERRLSWIAVLLPSMKAARTGEGELAKQIDVVAAWDTSTNLEAARHRLSIFTCPGNIPATPATAPAVTQYVGGGGIGAIGPTLDLGPPLSPLAGCFRFDAPTPLQVIYQNDGLSNSILFAEVSEDLGSWISGGHATVRGYDPDSTRPHLGRGGQFGGNHRGVAAFSFADGSARFLTDSTNANVLRNLFTIAGADNDPLPGE